MIGWDAKGPMVRERLGKLTAPEISEQIGIPVSAVRFFCRVNKLSLQTKNLKKKPPPPKPKSSLMLKSARKGIDLNGMWVIPSMAERLNG